MIQNYKSQCGWKRSGFTVGRFRKNAQWLQDSQLLFNLENCSMIRNDMENKWRRKRRGSGYA